MKTFHYLIMEVTKSDLQQWQENNKHIKSILAQPNSI